MSCVYSSPFSEHQILLTHCESINDIVLNTQDVSLEIKYKAVLMHEQYTNYHIILVNVDNI